MVEGRDPHQRAALDLDVVDAVRPQAALHLQGPAAGRPSAETLHVVVARRDLVVHEYAGDHRTDGNGSDSDSPADIHQRAVSLSLSLVASLTRPMATARSLAAASVAHGRPHAHPIERQAPAGAHQHRARHREDRVRPVHSEHVRVRHVGDEQRLTQVLLNLVGNAIKFTNAGEVRVTAMAIDGHFAVTVADTGPGIPTEHQTRIFDQFHQVDSSNTKAKGGTGLGLAIAKQIVEMHGGRIWVESTVGKGSTFQMEIPARAEVTRSG
jgi:signal transduction histidine kinase